MSIIEVRRKALTGGTAGNLKNHIDKFLVADLEQLLSCAL